MPTERQHSDAWVAALNARQAHAYDYGTLPDDLPEFYTEVTVTRRYGGPFRDYAPAVGLFRVTTRAVARYLVNAQLVRAKAAGIEGTVLTIDGQQTTPIAFESETVIGPDDGWYSGISAWTYGL